nr:MAK10-like protein [Tanacetum cinerariifolium]
MRDENPIPTLGDYSRPSHEGYRNTIELPNGNNVVPLRSDTIRLVQNGCSFHRLRSEDPNQHLKDILKLMESLDLDVTNRENGARTIDQAAGGKLRDKNAEESWALLEDLDLYDNESWNDPRDFAKLVKTISLPQYVPSISDYHFVEVKNQVQRFMEACLAPKSSVQVKKISSSCEICSGPHDTQFCMKNPEQAFIVCASSRTDKAGGKWFTFKSEQNNIGDSYNPSWKIHPNLSEMTNKNATFLKVINDRMRGAFPIVEIEKKVGGAFSSFETVVQETKSRDIKRENPNDRACGGTKEVDEVEEESEESEEEVKEEEDDPEYFDTFPTIEESGYHEWLLKNPDPLELVLRLNYYWIMSEGLKSRRKPSNPKKTSNFVRRVRGLKVFVEKSGLVYDKNEGKVTFEKDNENITFKMPHRMERFKHIDIEDLEKDNIPPFIITSDNSDQEKTHYSNSLNLGPAYRNFSKKEKNFFTDVEDGARIYPDDITSPATVIFDKEKPESS